MKLQELIDKLEEYKRRCGANSDIYILSENGKLYPPHLDAEREMKSWYISISAGDEE